MPSAKCSQMAKPDFKTIPDELMHVAYDVYDHYDNSGHDVDVEVNEIGFPSTPAMLCRRNHTTTIIEIASQIDDKRFRRWVNFAKSQTKDTRFVVVLRSSNGADATSLKFATDHQVGLIIHNDEVITVVCNSSDLAVHATLPDLKDLKKSVGRVLAPAFSKFKGDDWRDGLFEAYAEVEQHARDYMAESINAGRMVVEKRSKSGVKTYTPADIEKMTLGALKDAFSLIKVPTHKDTRIGQTLALINKTRIGLAHKRKKAEVEAEVRIHVGQHMHAVVSCLEDLIP